MERITDPLIELLAIKLYEHDHARFPPVGQVYSWLMLNGEDREIYRQAARGELVMEAPKLDRLSGKWGG